MKGFLPFCFSGGQRFLSQLRISHIKGVQIPRPRLRRSMSFLAIVASMSDANNAIFAGPRHAPPTDTARADPCRLEYQLAGGFALERPKVELSYSGRPRRLFNLNSIEFQSQVSLFPSELDLDFKGALKGRERKGKGRLSGWTSISLFFTLGDHFS